MLSLGLNTAAILLISLPPLASTREQLSTGTGIPGSTLWIPVLAITLVANYLIFKRIGKRLVVPSEELVSQTKLAASSFAFKKKSMNAEEDHLKHFIESICLRSVELEQEVNRMENEVERISESTSITPDDIDALNDKVTNAEEKFVASSKELANEQERSARLEKELSEAIRERKRALRDLETLREDLENAAPPPPPEVIASNEESEPTSLLVERLRNPLNLINNLSWRLARSWADTPPSQVREGLEEICKQSEEQLELLKKYRSTSDEDSERDAL